MTISAARRLAGGLATAVLTAGLLLAVPAPAQAASAGEFTSAINAARTSRGLPPLAVRGDLAAVAQAQAQRMAQRSDLFHNPNLGGSVRGWVSVAENVGYGPDAPTIHRAFMNSPGHRANILSGRFTEVGVGVVVRGPVVWVAEVFRLPQGTGGSGGGSDGGGGGSSGGGRDQASAGDGRTGDGRDGDGRAQAGRTDATRAGSTQADGGGAGSRTPGSSKPGEPGERGDRASTARTERDDPPPLRRPTSAWSAYPGATATAAAGPAGTGDLPAPAAAALAVLVLAALGGAGRLSRRGSRTAPYRGRHLAGGPVA